jgi:hypothetical protein
LIRYIKKELLFTAATEVRNMLKISKTLGMRYGAAGLLSCGFSNEKETELTRMLIST